LSFAFSEVSITCIDESSPTRPSREPIWKQVPLSNYFAVRRPPTLAPVATPAQSTLPIKSKSVRRALLRYNPQKKATNRVTHYTSPIPTYDLFDSWGHSLEVIDTSTIFKVFLQNPNSFPVHRNNHLLMLDLQTCYQYGAGALCFPETNTNWNQEGQLSTIYQFFRNTWQSSVLQPSQTPDHFLSTYQPGGTLTAICDNWVSRVFARGEDPFGLGRWSYVTLRGKSSVKVTIVTAYNATPSQGDQSYHHQKLCVLSRLHREQHINYTPDPCRKFILDLQAWLEHLIKEGHQLIVAMDANMSYDPDQLAQHHHLPIQPGQLTVSPSHNGKLATLVSTCQLCLPLALQHETRPFPASHIRGQNQIDYILVSKSILPAILRSGVLPHLSLTRGDHRPYYLDFDVYGLFSDPAYQIDPPNNQQLQLKDPRKINKYISNLHDLLGQHTVLT